MKYYSFETMFKSLKDTLKLFLLSNNIYFEISKDKQYYHFEIFTDPAGADKINEFLDNNTIWTVGVNWL